MNEVVRSFIYISLKNGEYLEEDEKMNHQTTHWWIGFMGR